MKILLLGKSGMLGSRFDELLKGAPDYEAHDKDELDIREEGSLRAAFTRLEPNLVINCAAYTAVDVCEDNPELASAINGKALEGLAKLCHEFGAKLIHFSTDYVFDGKNSEGYKEDDTPSPINVYGHSKLEGENLIRANAEFYYIVRTSWLFGKNGKNFVNTMLNISESQNELKIVDDQIGSPTYVNDLCDAVIANFVKGDMDFGVYHLTNSGSCSWFEFAKEIFKIKGRNVSVEGVSSAKFPRPAKRPQYSTLVNTKLDGMRPWQQAVKDYLTD